MMKICFKCGKELPHSSFYKHPKMPDGHLNKCIECFRAEMRERYDQKCKDPEWLKKERERGREKYRRLGYSALPKHHREARGVSKYFKAKGIYTIGCECHHWNYNFLYDVIVLPIGMHRKLHNLLKYDEESKCFFHNGELLTTKQQHIDLIKSIS